MTGIEWELSLGWKPEALRLELGLSDVMMDLEPRWQDWAGLEAATE